MPPKSRQRKPAADSPAGFLPENLYMNAEAQDFAFCIGQEGESFLKETLEARPPRSKRGIQRVLAACDVVATANGHTDAMAGRCRLIEEWLFESGYVPDAAATNLAKTRLERIMARNDATRQFDLPADRLERLRARLAKPARKFKRMPWKDDRPGFRALAKWLNTSQGEVDNGPQFDRFGNARVVLVCVSVNAACMLINYRKVNELALWLNNDNDPEELAQALKILLRGWRNTLTSAEFDHVPDATITDAERQLPYRALAKCRGELADLPRLESFTTQNMYFNDNLLQDVCQNSHLKHLTIVNAKISPRGFRRIASCKTLESVYASRCPRLTESDQKYLAARLPMVQYVTVSKPKSGS